VAVVVPLRNSVVALMVIGIITIIFVVNFIMPTIFERIECEEKGGEWMSVTREGCAMSPKVCEDIGGTPIGYLECKNILLLGCLDMGIDGCEFR